MSSAVAQLDVALQPEEIWKIIGGFGSLPDWFPEVSQSSLTDGGRIRHLHDSAGHTFVERLETYDHAAYRYSYSIVESPISVTDYLFTLAVTSRGTNGSHVEWSCAFTPINISAEDAANLFRGLFSSALQGLASHPAIKNPM